MKRQVPSQTLEEQFLSPDTRQESGGKTFIPTGGLKRGYKKGFLEVFSGMSVYARPHLLSSPPGEEIAFACFWFCG
ncbi:MAG: hypothetical protein ABSF10_20620 [Verrucomicrobiota bacterium]|jgi:hypothetical protein